MSKFIQYRASRTIELYHQKNVNKNKENNFITDRIKSGLVSNKRLDAIQKELLTQLPGSPTGNKQKIKKAVRVLKHNPRLRKLIEREEDQER